MEIAILTFDDDDDDDAVMWQLDVHYYRFHVYFVDDMISIGPTYAFQSHQKIGLFSILNFHTHFAVLFLNPAISFLCFRFLILSLLLS